MQKIFQYLIFENKVYEKVVHTQGFRLKKFNNVRHSLLKNVPQSLLKNVPQSLLKSLPLSLLKIVPRSLSKNVPRLLLKHFLQSRFKNVPKGFLIKKLLQCCDSF